MSTNGTLDSLLAEVDDLAEKVRVARSEVTQLIRREDGELAGLLNELWNNLDDQSDWLFTQSISHRVRPIDLIAERNISEVKRMIRSILHGLPL